MRYPGDVIPKDADSVEPQGMDWTIWLAELGVGVTISTSAWAVDSGPDALLLLSSPSIIPGNLKTQVFLSAGTVGGRYTVRNRIVTTANPTVSDDRSFNVLIVQK